LLTAQVQSADYRQDFSEQQYKKQVNEQSRQFYFEVFTHSFIRFLFQLNFGIFPTASGGVISRDNRQRILCV
jgi:hypothetical protein